MNKSQIIQDFRTELLDMHFEDIKYVLSVLLPEDANIEESGKEIEKWKQNNILTKK